MKNDELADDNFTDGNELEIKNSEADFLKAQEIEDDGDLEEFISNVTADEISNPLIGKKDAPLTTIGCINLMTALIEKAIEDYKALVKKGIIKDGKVIKGILSHQNRCCGMARSTEANQLVYWLKSDELQTSLDLACIDVRAETIREGLGIK